MSDEFLETSGSDIASIENIEPTSPAWMAVFSLAMGVFGLLTAEYLPASLLTPMAAGLGVSEALAGQAVTVTAVIAMFSGLLTASLTRRVDRRIVLLAFSVLMIASNLFAALSSSLFVLLTMRVLLGIALGGFWSMAAAVAMRLVPAPLLPRALSIIFSGISVATVVAVPLGSYLGGVYGWRIAFLAAAALGVLTLAFQFCTLPPLKPTSPARLGTILDVLRRPGIGVGMLSCTLVHTGQYALFTYIRPVLESVMMINVSGMALVLLAFGLANFIGTLIAGWVLERSLRATLVIMPLLIGAAGLGLIFLPTGITGQVLLVVLWGMAFGGVPVAWSNWVAHAVPDQAESAGGMVVVSVQSAIAAGAAVGGLMFSVGGVIGVFGVASAILLFSALLIALRVRTSPYPAI
ncbi:MFS transporter [Acetobacter cibinongensis]|uniref:Transporter n=1 Tax=Acetobacter cibinongensis TaxID=146475 RepID=A0A1Z5YV14_9PROT|nr:MFS transporter [Acetobacter cibinongensis]OUJ02493.1 transporter [Acetobacter cibinongensis]